MPIRQPWPCRCSISTSTSAIADRFRGGEGDRTSPSPFFLEMHFPMTGSFIEILQNPY